MNILQKIGMLSTSAATLQKNIGDALTVTITMTNPAPVHLIGFTVRAPESFELEDGKWGESLPIPDDEDIKESGPGAHYCEWSLKPDMAPVEAGTHDVATLRFRCTAAVSNAAIVLENFIGATYANGAPLQYESDVEQAPAITVVAQQAGGKVLVTVSVA